MFDYKKNLATNEQYSHNDKPESRIHKHTRRLLTGNIAYTYTSDAIRPKAGVLCFIHRKKKNTRNIM